MARHRNRSAGMNPDLHQSEHNLLRALLRRFLVADLESSHRKSGTDLVGCRAAAVLDSLLAAHVVDRQGRCRLCRGRRWLGHRRRACMVFHKAHYWLRQSPDSLSAHLASELGIDLQPSRYAADPHITQVPSGIDADRAQTPADPLALPPRRSRRAGRPDPDHGGAGVHLPERPWPRRGPSGALPSDPDQAVCERRIGVRD